MAQLVQRKLQALRGHRLLSAPSRLSSRQLACRWYGEIAMVEDSCDSSQSGNDADGRPVAASQGEKFGNKSEGFKDEGTKEKSNGSSSQASDSFKSLMEKLTSSVSDKSKNNCHLTADQGRTEAQVSEKASMPSDDSSKKEDIWQQVRSTIRSISLKNASKGATPDKSGLSKAGDGENHGEPGMAQSSSPSALKDSIFSTSFAKHLKQKNAQPQSSNQQKTKEAKPVSFSFLKALNEAAVAGKPQGNISQDLNQRNGDASSGKLNRGLDNAPPHRSASMNGSSRLEMQGRSTSNNDETLRSSTGYMVCVHNLPINSNPAMVKAAMATHGEVAGIFKRSSRDDSLSVFVQFKTAEGMEAALAARRLQIDGRLYNIARAELPLTTVVRLNRVSHDTTENQLQSVCERYGGLDNIRKRGNGIYDIYYKVKELPNMSSILGSLNEVTLNRSAWVALPAPILHPAVRKEVLKSREGQTWHENQTNMALGRIELGLDTVSVLFEDLKELVALGKESSNS